VTEIDTTLLYVYTTVDIAFLWLKGL